MFFSLEHLWFVCELSVCCALEQCVNVKCWHDGYAGRLDDHSKQI